MGLAFRNGLSFALQLPSPIYNLPNPIFVTIIASPSEKR
jgi:hypothetical protein